MCRRQGVGVRGRRALSHCRPGGVALFRKIGLATSIDLHPPALGPEHVQVEAASQFKAAMELQPEDARARLGLGNSMMRKGQLGEALAHYELAIRTQPAFAESHNNAGAVLLQMEQVDVAIAHFRRALEIQPGFKKAQENLADALHRRAQIH